MHAAAEGVARFGPDREEWPTSDEVRAIQQAVGSGWPASYELEGKDGEPLFHGILQVERPAARLLLDLNRRLAAVREECGPAVERALRKAIDRAIGSQAPDPSRVAAVRTCADYERLEAEFGDACEQALRDDPGFPSVLQTDRGIATEVVVLVRLQVPSVLQGLAGRPRRPGAAKRL